MALAERLILIENYLSVGPSEILESERLKGKVSIIRIKESLPTGRYVIVQRKKIMQPPLIKYLAGEIRHKLTLSSTTRFNHQNKTLFYNDSYSLSHED